MDYIQKLWLYLFDNILYFWFRFDFENMLLFNKLINP